jgi:hydrogenase expression/formation protein HypC
MCLAYPMRLESVEGDQGIAELEGLRTRVMLDLIENPRVGDIVLVHAGYAIERMDPRIAQETLDALRGILPDHPHGETS